MPTTLTVIGPIAVPFARAKHGSLKWIDKKHGRMFWQTFEAQTVTKKQGCYVFALRAGRGSAPWYVGKATKSMQQECFAMGKLLCYNAALFQRRRGRPVMFFVVPPGTKNKVRSKIVDAVEKYLIQSAAFRNPELTNIKNTKHLADWGIAGVVRSKPGKKTKASAAFARMMGL